MMVYQRTCYSIHCSTYFFEGGKIIDDVLVYTSTDRQTTSFIDNLIEAGILLGGNDTITYQCILVQQMNVYGERDQLTTMFTHGYMVCIYWYTPLYTIMFFTAPN